MNSNARCLLDLDLAITLSPLVSTNLINKHNQLLKKNVDDFSVEDIRFMIGQRTALEILLPRAIELLNENIIAEGDLFEGDLLLSVVSLDEIFWSRNIRWYNQISELINKSLTDVELIPLSKVVLKGVNHFLGLRENGNLVNDQSGSKSIH
ncbi:contact-dependent growth inhibition system immunity protein [Dyadobacter sp. OTU695]|uniref:contact-dependent growth inhibition system immunity protein n=1 Tax=Dyadobacter sp. OTU695 TaxID=3043860 RepID=UPI00313F2C7B